MAGFLSAKYYSPRTARNYLAEMRYIFGYYNDVEPASLVQADIVKYLNFIKIQHQVGAYWHIDLRHQGAEAESADSNGDWTDRHVRRDKLAGGIRAVDQSTGRNENARARYRDSERIANGASKC